MVNDVNVGYVVEQAIYIFNSTSLCTLCVLQFLIWRKHTSKPLHHLMIVPCFMQNLLTAILCVDVRGVYGLYSPTIVLLLTAIIIQIPAISTYIWLREISRLNERASDASHLSEREVPLCAVTLLSCFNVLSTFAFGVVGVLLNRLWYMGAAILGLSVVTILCIVYSRRFIDVLDETRNQLEELVYFDASPALRLSKSRMEVKLIGMFIEFVLIALMGVFLLVDPNATLPQALQTDRHEFKFSYLISGMLLLGAVVSWGKLLGGWQSLQLLNITREELLPRMKHIKTAKMEFLNR
eukprot:TRINITY_DN5667_c0_g1_i1.p1 TRINITY_DN5667_c0_g1~~TRINITY_DN5667_c0_g1_i1.p1  ORF type:complete len:295 (-),score=64.54 TRINITY_DN5667_c0_g1_i1:49-933(-)